MFDVKILRPSDFSLRSSDFRAAEHDLPSTGRTLEQPCDGGDGAVPPASQDFVGLGAEQAVLGCRPPPLLAPLAWYLPRSALLPDGVQRAAS